MTDFLDIEIVDYQGTKRKAAMRLRFIDSLTERLKDFRPVYVKAAEVFRQAEEQWFDSEGGGTWAPLTSSTQQWRARIGKSGNPILHAYGFLKSSLTGGPGFVSRFEPQQSNFGNGFQNPRITFGTDDPKAHFHQGGWRSGGGRGVARHVIPTQAERPAMWDEVTKIFTSHLSADL